MRINPEWLNKKNDTSNAEVPFFYEMEDDTIHIKFSLINPVPIIIILCVLILLAIIVVIANVVFVVMAKKRKNKVKSRENIETFSSVQNSNNSSPEEVLSDNVYIYRREDDRIALA